MHKLTSRSADWEATHWLIQATGSAENPSMNNRFDWLFRMLWTQAVMRSSRAMTSFCVETRVAGSNLRSSSISTSISQAIGDFVYSLSSL
jgi:hypothetical protein